MMNKLKILAIPFIFACNIVCAQQFGAHVGTSFSYFTDDFNLKGGNPGLLIGGLVNYPISDAILLTGGLDYLQISGSIDNTPTFTNNGALWLKESNITIHTIEASAYGAYKLPLSFLGDAAPYVMGGLSIGYVAGAWDRFETKQILNDGILTFKGNENVKALVTEWLPAWNVGLRFQSPLDGGLFTQMVLDFRLRSSFDPAFNTFPLNGSVALPGARSVSASLGFFF
ncbi:MAG: hypothetical protein WAU36_01475 [Cyclobacteriaceae bacterium]